MVVAAAGVLMNGTVAALLWRFSGDVNIRSVFLHMLGDTLSTAAVIAGGAAILFSGMTWIDPVLSILIAGMILWSSVGIIRETLNILLEGTPRNLQLGRGPRGDGFSRRRSGCSRPACVESGIAVTCSGESCDDCGDAYVGVQQILDGINCALRDRFHITHTTIQFETTGCETTHGCSAPPELEAVGAHGHHHGHDHSGHAH